MPVGWEYPEWLDSFFPDDLPEDWRLSYFSNEFSAVLVPQDYWIEADADQLATWADGVNEDFRFFLEVVSPVELSVCEKLTLSLTPNFGGIVLSQRLAGTDFEEKLSAVEQLTGKVIIMTEVNIGEPLPFLVSNANLRIALSITDVDQPDLKVRRTFFERLQERLQPDAEVLLCISGNPPDIESIRQLRQLARLMGLA